MRTISNNLIQDKSFEFARRIVRLYKYLVNNKKEYILSKQILKSGTSIGANVEEAIGAQSKKDFLAKISISYKEARETYYWLKLLVSEDLIEEELSKSIITDCEEILKILTAIQKSTKIKLSKI